MTQRKVAVIGLDSITSVMVNRFLAEGRMPHLQCLKERGWSSEIIPTMPPTTPAGWTTIATGAWPSTHGIEGFAVHVEGEPLDKKNHACTAERVKAEYIWQAAERVGKRSILLKYPMSWPPKGGNHVVQVDGAGGWGGLKCIWDLDHSACWDTAAASTNDAVLTSQWMTRDQDNLDEEHIRQLVVTSPSVWVNLPADTNPLWETRLDIHARGMAQGTVLYGLALQDSKTGVFHLLIAPSRDAVDGQFLQNRQWSEWFRVTLPTAQGSRSGHLRLKIMHFDAPFQQLRVYQTQIHQEDGYTRPESVAEELMKAAGPFVEWTESYDLLQGWIDDETQLEIYEQHVEWMSKSAQHLLKYHQWDLFMTQVHFIDMAYHLYWGAIDPDHPQYNAEKAPIYWQILGRVHELADQFLGAILKELDEDTLVVVLGDHGHDSYHTTYFANHHLIREGLLVPYRDQRTGLPRIDWKRSRAFANGYRIYLNVEGRDPQGLVTSDEYKGLQDHIIQMLYSLQDPRTGKHPVCIAMRREDAVSIGLYSGSMGDIVFAMAPGFQTRSGLHFPKDAWSSYRLHTEHISMLQQTELFQEFTGEHDTASPFTAAIRTLLFMDGPGIQPNQAIVPGRLIDIAPTICQYLNIPFPKQCEGNPMMNVFLQPHE